MVLRRIIVLGTSLACFGWALISSASTSSAKEESRAVSRSLQETQHSSMNALTGEDVGLATTSFGISLFREIASSGQDVFVSPISIASALAMVAVGATVDHKTQVELERVLGFQVRPL